jgi:hypothetical protein
VSDRESKPPYRGYLPPDPLGIPEPHDTLAAEEFGIGTRDERWPKDPSGVDRPHDTLAAEEFAIGMRDDRWPRDPSGYDRPHDILAAEAFPMPVPGVGGTEARRGSAPGLLAAGLLALAALLLVRRR